MTAVFSKQEAQVLNDFLEKGGILIRIPNNHRHSSHILKEDGNGCFEIIGVLDYEISIKLFELYCEPTPMGYHLIGLKDCIHNFC